MCALISAHRAPVSVLIFLLSTIYLYTSVHAQSGTACGHDRYTEALHAQGQLPVVLKSQGTERYSLAANGQLQYDAAGTVIEPRPPRVAVKFNTSSFPDAGFACHAAGEVITATHDPSSDSAARAYTCTADDVLTTARAGLVSGAVQSALDWMQANFLVPRLVHLMRLQQTWSCSGSAHSPCCVDSALPLPEVQSPVDLTLLITARPAPLAYSAVCNVMPDGRPVLAHINVPPHLLPHLAPAQPASAAEVDATARLVLHHAAHTMGVSLPLIRQFAPPAVDTRVASMPLLARPAVLTTSSLLQAKLAAWYQCPAVQQQDWGWEWDLQQPSSSVAQLSASTAMAWATSHLSSRLSADDAAAPTYTLPLAASPGQPLSVWHPMLSHLLEAMRWWYMQPESLGPRPEPGCGPLFGDCQASIAPRATLPVSATGFCQGNTRVSAGWRQGNDTAAPWQASHVPSGAVSWSQPSLDMCPQALAPALHSCSADTTPFRMKWGEAPGAGAVCVEGTWQQAAAGAQHAGCVIAACGLNTVALKLVTEYSVSSYQANSPFQPSATSRQTVACPAAGGPVELTTGRFRGVIVCPAFADVCTAANQAAVECSGHGVQRAGECACDVGWEGAGCSQQSCPRSTMPQYAHAGACAGHAYCDKTSGTCKSSAAASTQGCYVGWSGLACDVASTSSPLLANCSARGTMQLDDSCQCNTGYAGQFCELVACPATSGVECSGHGTCFREAQVCQCAMSSLLPLQRYSGVKCDRTETAAVVTMQLGSSASLSLLERQPGQLIAAVPPSAGATRIVATAQAGVQLWMAADVVKYEYTAPPLGGARLRASAVGQVELLVEPGPRTPAGNWTVAIVANASASVSVQVLAVQCASAGCAGTCQGSVCVCPAGWGGERCDQPRCAASGSGQTCSGHGTCVGSVGSLPSCHCTSGWQGATCSTPAAPASAYLQVPPSGSLVIPGTSTGTSVWTNPATAQDRVLQVQLVQPRIGRAVEVRSANQTLEVLQFKRQTVLLSAARSDLLTLRMLTPIWASNYSAAIAPSIQLQYMQCFDNNASAPACSGHGACAATAASVVCTCVVGWAGQACDVPVSTAAPAPGALPPTAATASNAVLPWHTAQLPANASWVMLRLSQAVALAQCPTTLAVIIAERGISQRTVLHDWPTFTAMQFWATLPHTCTPNTCAVHYSLAPLSSDCILLPQSLQVAWEQHRPGKPAADWAQHALALQQNGTATPCAHGADLAITAWQAQCACPSAGLAAEHQCIVARDQRAAASALNQPVSWHRVPVSPAAVATWQRLQVSTAQAACDAVAWVCEQPASAPLACRTVQPVLGGASIAAQTSAATPRAWLVLHSSSCALNWAMSSGSPAPPGMLPGSSSDGDDVAGEEASVSSAGLALWWTWFTLMLCAGTFIAVLKISKLRQCCRQCHPVLDKAIGKTQLWLDTARSVQDKELRQWYYMEAMAEAMGIGSRFAASKPEHSWSAKWDTMKHAAVSKLWCSKTARLEKALAANATRRESVNPMQVAMPQADLPDGSDAASTSSSIVRARWLSQYTVHDMLPGLPLQKLSNRQYPAAPRLPPPRVY